MENKHCKNCTHFHQHYGLNEKRLFRVFCGHCTATSRIRIKQPDAPACNYFVPAPPIEDSFATKEYLSKALAEYMLHLELLPHIADTQDK